MGGDSGQPGRVRTVGAATGARPQCVAGHRCAGAPGAARAGARSADRAVPGADRGRQGLGHSGVADRTLCRSHRTRRRGSARRASILRTSSSRAVSVRSIIRFPDCCTLDRSHANRGDWHGSSRVRAADHAWVSLAHRFRPSSSRTPSARASTGRSIASWRSIGCVSRVARWSEPKPCCSNGRVQVTTRLSRMSWRW